MKTSRLEKLKKFHEEKREVDRLADLRKLATSDFDFLPEREAFVDELSKKIDTLREVLGTGLEITNIDALLYELAAVKTLEPAIEELKKTIAELSLPDAVDINGLADLTKALKKDLKVSIDLKPIESIPKQLAKLTDKIKSITVPKQGQQPNDYIPTRRVMKVGNTLMYDDSFYTGGGGGSSIPTKNGSVPVVNPDGSNIGGSGAVTNDGTFATPTKQDTGNTSLSSIDTKLTSQATASNQTTANSSLSTIATNTGNGATSSNQSTLNTRVGDVTETSPATDTASSGLNGRLQRIAQRLTSIIALLPGSLGQKARAASLAVTLSSEDVTALTPTAAITNYAQETGGNLAVIAAKDFATQTTLALIKAKTDNIDVVLSTRTKPADQQHVIVDSGVTTGLTDTQLRATPVPISGTVTANTGLTQPLTDTQLRATALPVSGTFFQVTQPVSIAATVATLETRPASEASTNVTNSTNNQTALASNANRRMATFYNDDTLSTGASVYLKCGASASATSFKIKIAPGGYFELPQPVYTGIIDVLATANTGTLRVTETT